MGVVSAYTLFERAFELVDSTLWRVLPQQPEFLRVDTAPQLLRRQGMTSDWRRSWFMRPKFSAERDMKARRCATCHARAACRWQGSTTISSPKSGSCT